MTLSQITGSRKARRITVDCVIYLLLGILAVFTVLPIIWLVFTSLKSSGEVFPYPPRLIPQSFQWQNYAKTWSSSNFSRYFLNTVIVTACVVAGQLLTSSMAAYSFSRLRYRSRNKLFLLYLGTMMIPSQVTMIPCFIIIKSLGWQDTYAAMIMPLIFTAFGTFLLRQFFLSIPHELDEAATIDGASYFTIYSRIILPLSKTALATLSVFAFMNTWNAFLWPLIVVNSDDMRTLTLGLINFRGLYTADWNLIMCATVISIIPILIAYLSAQRYFIEGIAMSAVKG